ncbi:cobalt-precorrin-7 (C(5))-methyltransferase [Methanosalsum natronophilum]|uniref:Cobalt-precorrin-7 (C(5))-methyltransferase n=1 Tax=Methanosalsum natronophilum TaxID=768733 RepID=A0A3R7VUI2_9EURY|nr:cobalt-precorrin-7 (C(5))-methyltransferase [Methanosalsum natronophilum]MCS3923972.1 cobalt-precorrin-7 (C5)-methyltransferase [Methanosalsum natronophilum]RQD92181.1 MAG: cobalt-precorrin-7 (C(5))-methyltransferase [Methanosalsum natronophilum]
MIVVGIGVGPGMLTEEAIDAIRNANIIYGSKRSIEMVREYITCESKVIKNYRNFEDLPKDAVVLSTGDPMFSGLGKYASESDYIIPGISSLQITCCRLGVSIDQKFVAITSHGRNPAAAKEAFIQELNLGKTIFLLPADNFGVPEIVKIIKDSSSDAAIHVCENIGYTDERIASGTIEHPPEVKSKLYSIMVIPK